MAKHKRKGGRVTPKGPRPPHLRPVREPTYESSPVDGIIDSAGRDLLEAKDPVRAENWASTMLDMFERTGLKARQDGLEAPPFVEALAERCRQRGDLRAAAVAAALAAVVPPSHEGYSSLAIAASGGVAAGTPAWFMSVGRVTPTRAWIASDVFGDQDSLIVGFRQEGQPGEHALVVLVDHNLSGQAKDAWIAGDAEAGVAAWKSGIDEHMQLDEAPVDEVLRQVRDAVAMSDLWNGDTELRTDDFAHNRALIWARLRRAGFADSQPSLIEVEPADRRVLVSEFMSSSEGQRLAGGLPGTDVESLAHYVVDLRSDYEGRPLRWSPDVVARLLGDLAPRKLLIEGDEAAALPEVVRGFVRFSAERTGLERTFVDEILAAVDQMQPVFLDRIGDPSAAGPAKSLLTALRARGVDITDEEAINAALEQGGPIQLPKTAAKKRRRPTSAPDEVVASASRAPVLDRFDILRRFYGDGRKLTQTGQPTLADAKQLVSLLGTQDRVDQTIGDRTFKTQSAAELPELGFMIRWAQSAGALRKQHGKLQATATWSKLEGKPLERWVKAADALTSLGPLAAYHAGHRYRDPDEFLDEVLPEVFALLEGKEPAFDEMLDLVCARADAGYEWFGPYMENPDHRRTSFGWDLDHLSRILGWAGVADRVGATVEPDRYGGERLIGGTLQLSPVGRWWLAEP